MPKGSRTITRFRGIQSATSVANIPPDSAIKCNNVIGDKGGWLNQMQMPTTLIDWGKPANAATNLAAILSAGYVPTPAKDPRLIIQQGKKVFYVDTPYAAATQYDGGDLAGIIARLDYAVANGITYFCNGQEASYVTPTGTRRFPWGILPPIAAPQLIASTSYGAGVTVQRTANITTITFGAAPVGSIAVGQPVYIDGAPSKTWDASFVGVYRILTSVGLVVTVSNPGPNTAPFGRGAFTEGIPASTEGGYSWTASYGTPNAPADPDVAHWSSVSAATVQVNTPANFGGVLLVPASTDLQVGKIALFRNQDGGGTQYLTNAGAGSDGQAIAVTTGDYPGSYVILDYTTDEQLATSAQLAPYDNGVAPLGKYLSVWLDRVLMCGIGADPTAVRYTGYDSLPMGRPQMSWCQFNNIRLGQGKALPCGMGPLRYGGMVFFATDGLMYIYRGTLNDITTSAPTSLSFYAEQLPYNIGLYSHFSIQSTPAGLVWLDDGLNLRVYENSGFYPPKPFAPQLAGILKRITPGTQDVIQSAYVNMLQQDWYVLAIPVDGSTTNNMLIVIDASADPNKSTGVWPCDYAVNGLMWIEMADKSKKLIATMPYLPGSILLPQAGYLTEIPVTDGITQGIEGQTTALEVSNPPMPGAFWQGGYIGVKDEDGRDMYNQKKFFRYLRYAGNSPGVRFSGYMVDGDEYNFDKPAPYPVELDPGDWVGGINVKGRAFSLRVDFPDDATVPISLNTLMLAFNPVTEV